MATEELAEREHGFVEEDRPGRALRDLGEVLSQVNLDEPGAGVLEFPASLVEQQRDHGIDAVEPLLGLVREPGVLDAVRRLAGVRSP